MNESQMGNYRLLQKVLKPVFDVTMDSSIMNPHFVPDEGPFVLVANHRSDMDPFALIVNIRRPINWLGASYLWNLPLGGQFFNGIGAIPVSKYRSEISEAFDRAADMLERGQGVGIFPEGWDYISANQFDWSVGEFQTGFARIAMMVGAPIVPVALQGLSETRGKQAFPPFMRKLLDYPIEMQYIKDRCVYKKLHINVGKPIPCPKGVSHTDRKAVLAFTKKVNKEVIKLYEELPKAVVGFENITRQPAGPRPPEPLTPEQAEAELAASMAEAEGLDVAAEQLSEEKPAAKKAHRSGKSVDGEKHATEKRFVQKSKKKPAQEDSAKEEE